MQQVSPPSHVSRSVPFTADAPPGEDSREGGFPDLRSHCALAGLPTIPQVASNCPWRPQDEPSKAGGLARPRQVASALPPLYPLPFPPLTSQSPIGDRPHNQT
jgi:hypothetical protein